MYAFLTSPCYVCMTCMAIIGTFICLANGVTQHSTESVPSLLWWPIIRMCSYQRLRHDQFNPQDIQLRLQHMKC